MATQTASKTNVKSGEIAARAYQIWETSGRPAGSELKNWLQAEEELATARAAKGHAALAKSSQQPEPSTKESSKPQPNRSGAPVGESARGARQHAAAVG